ncbi:hypothetical protein [Mycolicibacterium phlei]|jgi:hypothetical protein
MTAAVTVDTVDVPESESPVGLVAVAVSGFARYGAVCGCGWTGGRRWLKAAAEQDAWMHAIHARCEVAVPLVRPAR